MSTILANRAQSAYPRTTYQSSGSRQDDNLKNRPITSMAAHQPFTNPFDDAALRTLRPATMSPPPSRRQRPKTSSTSGRSQARSASRKLRSDEIESLLRSLDRNDAFVVQVDSLANYRTLAQTLDLRRTPMDCQVLCALQQRENCIVQRNACRDARFRSLLNILAPPHALGGDDQANANDGNRSVVSDYPYPPSDLSYEYIK